MDEAEYLRSLKAPYVVHLRVSGYPIRVAVNDRRLEKAVRRYFEPFLSPASAGEIRVTGIVGEPILDRSALRAVQRPGARPKIAYYDRDGVRVVLKKRSGVVHYVWRERCYAVGDLIRHPQQLFNLVGLAFGRALRRKGHIALHASGVARGGSGTAFVGQSGSGKSTLALSLMEFGYDYVSNDRVFIGEAADGVEITGVPKWPRVNPGTLLASDRLRALMSLDEIAKYRTLSRAELWDLEDKHDVPLESVYGHGRLALRVGLEALYVLAWKAGGGPPAAQPVAMDERAEALLPFVKTEAYDPSGSSASDAVKLSALLRDVPVYRVSGGADIPWLARRLLESDDDTLADSA
jgi:HprK-related kinase B